MFFFYLPVIQSVSNAHVVGELFPQGSFQLTLGLDGLQGLSELTLGDLFQSDGILQLAVEELSVLLKTTDLMLQTLKLHLGEAGEGTRLLSGFAALTEDWFMCGTPAGSKS